MKWSNFINYIFYFINGSAIRNGLIEVKSEAIEEVILW